MAKKMMLKNRHVKCYGRFVDKCASFCRNEQFRAYNVKENCQILDAYV